MMMLTRYTLAALLLGAVLLAGTPAVAAEYEPPGPEARCPVCGMFVSPHPNWVASIVFGNGEREYFDGPKDLFRYFFDLENYRPEATSADIDEVFVTEYYTLRPVPAGSVLFVSGSDVLGPMGKELVPIAGKDEAQTFMRDHGGAKLMRFDGSGLVEVGGGE